MDNHVFTSPAGGCGAGAALVRRTHATGGSHQSVVTPSSESVSGRHGHTMIQAAKHALKRLAHTIVFSDEQWLVVLVLCVCVVHVIGLVVILLFY